MSASDDAIESETPGEGLKAGVFRYVPMGLAAIGTLWILLLMALVVADVLGRNFLDAPITGVAEFAGRSVVAIVYLQLPWAIVSGRMTRAGFLVNILARRAPRVRCALEIIYLLIGVVLFALLAYASWPQFSSAWASGEYFGVRGQFTMVTWPFRGLLVLGSVLALLACLALIPAYVRSFIERRAEPV